MDLEDLRLSVYRSFVADGRPPAVGRLAEELASDTGAVRRGLRTLAHHRHLVLDQHDEVVMAHPFSAVALGFAVMAPGRCGGAAAPGTPSRWPTLLPAQGPLLVSTRCPGCARAHVWNVDRHAPPDGEQVAHFLIPAAHMWDDAVHTCRHQRIFCSTSCVDTWVTSTGSAAGYAMVLDTLWHLAAHWCDGRLERGYVRREPAAAADYLRAVGLTGPFWGP